MGRFLENSESASTTGAQRVLAVVPARKGSKRLPGKNLLSLAGRPLIAWTISTAVESGLFCDVLVTTDCSEIASAAVKAGASVPWLRPPELAGDDSPSIDAVAHALRQYEADNGSVDAVALLQPTSPFRRIRTLEQAMARFRSGGGNTVVSVSRAQVQPQALGTIGTDDQWRWLDAAMFPGDGLLALNGLIWLSASKTIRGGRLYSEFVIALKTEDPMEALDIDTPHDWRLAESVAEAGPDSLGGQDR